MSEVITITAPSGFENEPDPHTVYVMVDSYTGASGGQVAEIYESNNVSSPLTVGAVGFSSAPTPTPPLTGSADISGNVNARFVQWVPQPRADVYLYDETNQRVASQVADENGYYIFESVPTGTYSVIACLQSTDFYGIRTGITPPNPIATIYMLSDSGGCALPDD